MAKPSRKSKKPAAKPRKRGKGGRPAVKIDIGDLEKLAGLQCTYAEVAAFFGCSELTIKRRLSDPKYREVYDQGTNKGLISLRRAQFRQSENSATMAIWLGKQYLGQSDKLIHEGGERPAIVRVEHIIVRPADPDG